MVWGNNVFSYDQALLVRTFGPVSRSLEQLGGMLQGAYPRIRILTEAGNQQQVAAIQQVRRHLLLVGGLVVAALLALLISLGGWWLARRQLPPGSGAGL